MDTASVVPTPPWLNQAISEVLKFTPPGDILRSSSIVSARWHAVSQCDDLWGELIDLAGYPRASFGLTKKWQYRRSLRESMRIPVFGYNFFCVFDCRTRRWRRFEKRESMVDAVSVFVGDGSLVCTGGRGAGGGWGCRRVMKVTNQGIGYGEDMKFPRIRHAAVVVGEDLYVFGGECRESHLASSPTEAVKCYSRVLWRTCERLRVDGGGETWKEIESMPTAKTRVSACRHGRDVYVCGWQADVFIEVLDTTTLQYRVLPLHIPELFFLMGSFIVMNSDQLTLFVHHKPDTQLPHAQFAEIPLEVRDCILGLSTGRAVRGTVYVELFGGSVAGVDLSTGACEVYNFK